MFDLYTCTHAMLLAQVFLCHVDQFFGDVTCPWNREYANAQKCAFVGVG